MNSLKELIDKLASDECFQNAGLIDYMDIQEAVKFLKHYSQIKDIIDFWNNNPDIVGDEQDVDYFLTRYLIHFQNVDKRGKRDEQVV